MSEEKTEAVGGSRILVGLQAGRIVNYVMLNGKVRPMIVTEPFDGSFVVNGLLFFDGLNDRGNFPNPRRAGDSGYESLTAEWIEGAKFHDPFTCSDPAGFEFVAGTWHWPAKQAVRASSVDANVLETLVEQLGAKLREELLGNQEQMIATVNEKLNANLTAVNDSLDSHSQLIQKVANFGSIVVGQPGETGSTGSGDVAGTGETGSTEAQALDETIESAKEAAAGS